MSNQTIIDYLHDNSIDRSKKERMVSDLKAGKITEVQAVGFIERGYSSRSKVMSGGSPDVNDAIEKSAKQNISVVNQAVNEFQSPGSQFKKPWEYSAKDFMGSAIGQFAQKQAPQLEEAMKQEATQGPAQRIKNVAGQFTGGVGNVIGGAFNVVGGALSQLNPLDSRTVTEKATQAISGINQAVEGAGQVVSSPLALSPVLQKGASIPFEGAHDVINNALKEAGVDTESEHGQTIARSLLNGLTLATVGPKKITEGITEAINLGEKTANTLKNYIPKEERIVNYKKNLDEIIGQITQGKVKDIAANRRALHELDVENVHNYHDLSATIKDKLEAVRNKQDEHLRQFKDELPIDYFEKSYSKGKSTTTINPVKTALDQLEELYTKTTSPEDLVRIQDIKTKAYTDGLNFNEINNLSREYGANFGRKAFSKTGDQLTSVNAQAFENTRALLKTTVRDKLPTNEAKIMDAQMHDLLNFDENINKMVENVNKLKQKVQKRGLGEKAGRTIGAIVDTASGGLIKGLIEKFLSRGTGLKTLNALDLEAMLTKNLKKIEKWNKMIDENPYEVIKQVKKELLALPPPKSGAPNQQINVPMQLPEKAQSSIDAKEQARIKSQQFIKKATQIPNQKLLPSGNGAITLPDVSPDTFRKAYNEGKY